MKHIHADLMLAYAKDAQETDKPWERWQIRLGDDQWDILVGNPVWDERWQYRRKPKTILVNGIEVPEPVRVPLVEGDTYYYADITLDDCYRMVDWRNDRWDKIALERGLIHLSKENAIAHAKAMLANNGGKS